MIVVSCEGSCEPEATAERIILVTAKAPRETARGLFVTAKKRPPKRVAYVPALFAKFNHKFLRDGLGLFSVKRAVLNTPSRQIMH
jgi:hypothetical protein